MKIKEIMIKLLPITNAIVLILLLSAYYTSEKVTSIEDRYTYLHEKYVPQGSIAERLQALEWEFIAINSADHSWTRNYMDEKCQEFITDELLWAQMDQMVSHHLLEQCESR